MFNLPDAGSKGKMMHNNPKQSALQQAEERVSRADDAQLTALYGKIGPAALLAALAFAKRDETRDAAAKLGKAA